MLTKWLTFGLTSDQEDRYRRSCLPADLVQAKVCILLLLPPVFAFAINDYLFLRLSWPFYVINALRAAILVGGILLVERIRKGPSYRTY